MSDELDLLADTKNKIKDVYELAETDDGDLLFKDATEICNMHNSRTEYYPNVPKITDIAVDKDFKTAVLSLLVGPERIVKISIDLGASYE